ncbi:hypothetical protein [Bradyrhizobium sp.]|uniref:hypothetical protein n=1 Tax=Bradyrhizobium sp. TaxID=376 RepID=UPI0025BF9FA7|nr:hypothetical protein [Bradyrhizobium sp.]
MQQPLRWMTLAAAAAVMTLAQVRAEDRLVLPEITITAIPPPDISHEKCSDKPTGNEHSLGCLNEQMRHQVDTVNPPALNVPPIDAKSSDLKVGTVNIPGVQQQYGKNFGHSVVPFRPPPPIYSSIGAAGRH